MVSAQREFGVFVVIKIDLLPFVGHVARLTLLLVSTFVHIVESMTVDTLFRRVLVSIALMTEQACSLLVPPL